VLKIYISYVNKIDTTRKYNRIEKFYDNIAIYYDEKWWYNNPDSRHVKIFASEIIYSHILPEKFVLDVGCGTCDTPIKLSSKDCKIIGLDISSNMLAIAKEKIPESYRNEISLVKGNAEKLPFDDDQFDYVISDFTLNYVDNPKTAMDEMLRVLKKDGRLLLIFSNRNPMYIVFWELLIGNIDFIKKLKKNEDNISFPYAKIKTQFKRFSKNDIQTMVTELPIQKIQIIGTHGLTGFIGYPILLLGLFIQSLEKKKFEFDDIDHFIKMKGERIVFNIFKKGESLDKHFNTIGRDIIFIGKKI